MIQYDKSAFFAGFKTALLFHAPKLIPVILCREFHFDDDVEILWSNSTSFSIRWVSKGTGFGLILSPSVTKATFTGTVSGVGSMMRGHCYIDSTVATILDGTRRIDYANGIPTNAVMTVDTATNCDCLYVTELNPRAGEVYTLTVILDSAIPNRLVTESGDPLITESGDYLVTEGGDWSG